MTFRDSPARNAPGVFVSVSKKRSAAEIRFVKSNEPRRDRFMTDLVKHPPCLRESAREKSDMVKIPFSDSIREAARRIYAKAAFF